MIELLPALPSQWRAGSVEGLRARGGFELDFAWQDGEIRRLKIHSLQGKDFVLRWGARTKSYSLRPGESLEVDLTDWGK